MPSPLFCYFSIHSILILSLATCSHAFYAPQKLPSRDISLFATSKLDKHVALAKHSFLRLAAAVLSVPSDVFTSPPMLEPPTKSVLEVEHCRVVTELLAQGWNELEMNMESSQTAVSNDSNASNTTGRDPSTYGEITELGARQLFHYLKLNDNDGGDVCFYDLGSGAGKLVAQAFLQVPRLQRAVGVELDSARHETATCAWNSIKDQAHDIRATFLKKQELCHYCKDASVEFLQGDLFDVDVSDATHVYIASLCFTSDMMERLADKLAMDARELQCVATLKPFPKRFERRFGIPFVEHVEMSWTKPRGEGCAVYFYTPLPSP